MLTRCPSCQTVFRLTSEQLLARQGRVRCGSCLHPFNALDHLAESDPRAGQPDRQIPPGKAATFSTQPGVKPGTFPAEPAPAAASNAAPDIPPPNDASESQHPAPSIDITASATPRPRPILAPVVKKSSQRLLSELDFSSSIDTKSRMPWQTQTLRPLSTASPPPLDIGEPDIPVAAPEQNATVEAPPAPPQPEAIPIPVEITPSPPIAVSPAKQQTPSAPPEANADADAKIKAKPEAKPQTAPKSKRTLAATEPPPPEPAQAPPPLATPPLAAAKRSAPVADSVPPAAAPPPAPPASLPPAPAAPPARLSDDDSIFSQMDGMSRIARGRRSNTNPSTTASVAPLSLFTMIPDDDESIFSQMDGMPRVTRGRDKDKDKRTKRSRHGKPAASSKPPSPSGEDAKAPAPELAQSNPPAQSVNEAADESAPDEMSAKIGLAAKIDKIEAEINAERKTVRHSSRSKKEAADETGKESAKHRAGSHFDIYGRPMTKRERIAWTSVVSALGVALAVQTTLLFRHSLARAIPGTRPLLVSICNTFDCAMPLPRDAEQIRIDDYGVLRQDDRPGHYVFYATISNRAGFVQDWPNIELTLLDITNQPLVRRVITPDEWAPPEQRAKEGIAPHSDISVRMDLEVASIDPSNYRIDHFYP
ncbi:MAG: zinc-ribbon domain-containing protein [Azoarcus sp.]|jgi:predicted Zn finger-like uncharacterized protein|nr:zinc-ribbon domain-containing protein [Azoarcus sp.]